MFNDLMSLRIDGCVAAGAGTCGGEVDLVPELLGLKP